MLKIVFLIISPAAFGAVLPGNDKARTASVLYLRAASKSTPPGSEARSIIMVLRSVFISKSLSKIITGIVLKTRSYPFTLLRAFVLMCLQPSASIYAKSTSFLALTVTCALRDFSIFASIFPILPNPQTRHLLSKIVPSYSFIAISTAPSAVSNALATANSSFAE